MKVSKLLSTLLLCMAVAFTSCEKEPDPILVTGITLDTSSRTLTEGESAKLTATISPSNADNQGVIWSSSNASVATVSNGTISAVAAGTATITAKSDDGGKTATCTVEVKAKSIPVLGVSLDKSVLELTEGDEATLTATVSPDNASNKNVFWNSSDNSIASVENGVVKALKPGRATISVKTSDGNKTASCSVMVNERIYHVESVVLDQTSLELAKGEEYTLVATVLPENATYKSVSWSSDNDKVATVSNGKITAVGSGNATITVKTVDGSKIATCVVTVKRVVPEDAVDMGLSVLWASCNLGASSPVEYGDYYAWGEIETKSDYSKETYKFYKSEIVSEDDFDYEYKGYTKYIPSSKADTYGFRGFYDNKSVLEPGDDAVRVKLGGKWRIPTNAEFDELINNCQCDWVIYNGVYGMKFTSKIAGYTDKWIFLPAAGWRYNDNLNNVASRGNYWSSSLRTSYPSYACFISFTSGGVVTSTDVRYYGHSVRPVCE